MKLTAIFTGKKEELDVELREVSPTSASSSASSSASPQLPQPTAKTKTTVRWKDLPHKDQLAILVLARLAEPLVQTSLQAYMFWQLRSFDHALSDATISWQAGVLQASFSAAQTLTGVFWGRVADRFGRKAVLIIGSVGTLVSCLGFGLAQSFVMALVFRSLGGLVNGNIAVIRTMVSEVIQEKKFQSRAFLLMPMCYNIGALIGPLLGGVLSDPATTYPSLFAKVGWMQYWPYLLPNLASAAIVLVSLVTIVFGLRETLADGSDQPDLGRLFANKVLRAFHLRRSSIGYHQVPTSEQGTSLLNNQETSGPEDEESKAAAAKPSPKSPKPKPRLPFRRIWTANVLLTLLAHFATAFHLGTFNSLWFIFLSADRSQDPEATQHFPFHFTGGLALRPQLVGLAMSILGLIGITLQLLIYPRVNDRYGVLPPYRLFVFCFPVAYALAPYLAMVPSTTPPDRAAGGVAVWTALCLVLALFVVGRTFVLPATMILVNNCTPHPSVLGTVHGVAASVGSLARTLGPAVAGVLFGVGLDRGVVGLAWWVLAGLGAFAVLTSRWVRDGPPEPIWLDGDEEEDERGGRHADGLTRK